MKKNHLLLVPLLFSIGLLFAQDCPVPDGGTFLHGNNVRTFINSDGNLFTHRSGASFQIHGTEPAHAIYAQGLWLGALDDGGNLKLAAQTYGRDMYGEEADYYAGPLNETGGTDAETCQDWDRVWTVFRHQIEAHIADFEEDGLIDSFYLEILEWPAKGNPYFYDFVGFELPDTGQGLAPFFDYDGDGLYDPLSGDYPMPPRTAVIPEQITWSIFNDAGGPHMVSNGNPLQVEVHLTTWAYQCTNNAQLDNTIFTSYKLVNRGTELLDSLYFGLWVDFDLGCMIDDCIGSMPVLNTVFAYNLDNEDDLDCVQNTEGYGPNPPVLALTVLNKALSYVTYHLNSNYGALPFIGSDPGHFLGFYRYLTGYWNDGTPFTFGGNGYDPSLSNPITPFVFPGDPNNPNEWSDFNDGIVLGDRRAVSSLLIEALAPGGSEEVDAAYSWFREPGADHLGNVSAMYEGVENLQAWYDGQFEGICSPRPACNTDCIWSGDLNADGIANHNDLLALAVATNRQGPVRSGPYNWSPQTGEAWASAQPGGANDKHLDADGDGEITFDDFRFTTQHYNFTHSNYQPIAEYREGPELQLIVDNPEFDFNALTSGQGTMSGIIKLTTTVPDLFGLAYTLEYDTAYFAFIYDPFFSNSSGQKVFKTASLIRAFPGDSDHARVDTVDTIEQGNLHNLWIKVKESFSYPLPADSTLIRFKNIKAIRRDGTEIEVGGTTVVARFPGLVADEEVPSAPDIHLFPNPTTGWLELQFPGRQVKGIIVLDITGRKVWAQEGRFIDVASVDLRRLTRGTYFVRMQLDGTVVVRRIVLY